MSERHQKRHQCPSCSERHQRPSYSKRQQRRISTQLNFIANQLPEVNQDFLNLARSQLEVFNELQRSHQSAQPSQRSRSRSPAPPCSRSPPPYTSYRQRPRQFSPTARSRTPSTPYRPTSLQEPLEPDTLPDAPNRSPTPSVLGWDTYIGNHQPARGTNPLARLADLFHIHPPSPHRDHTRSPSFHRRRGNIANRGDQSRRGGIRGPQRNIVQDSTFEQDNRSGANRGRGQRQHPHPLHKRIHF